VHQDVLVQTSALAERFVKHSHEVVMTGDLVKVRDVDLRRRRIAFTMRLADEPEARPAEDPRGQECGGAGKPAQQLDTVKVELLLRAA
jgi:uncharacterized protein